MNTDQNTLPTYIALLFPFLFIAFWILISLLISVVSGWHTLARRFTADSGPYGETRTAGLFFYSVYTRFWTHYSSVIP
jgi:hypothetical protein